jgi:PncC family amidohydrolase
MGEILITQNLTLALAESVTGGRLASWFTSVPGSSNYFLGGVVAYSNASKCSLLKIAKTTLESFGAVSSETAQEMAKGARKIFAADIALSTTGIAGPSGASVAKPVGTCFIALATGKQKPDALAFCFSGNRIEIQEAVCQQALLLLKKHFGLS